MSLGRGAVAKTPAFPCALLSSVSFQSLLDGLGGGERCLLGSPGSGLLGREDALPDRCSEVVPETYGWSPMCFLFGYMLCVYTLMWCVMHLCPCTSVWRPDLSLRCRCSGASFFETGSLAGLGPGNQSGLLASELQGSIAASPAVGFLHVGSGAQPHDLMLTKQRLSELIFTISYDLLCFS